MNNRFDINRIKDIAFKYFGIFCTLFGLIMLAVFLFSVLKEGLPRLNGQFFSSFHLPYADTTIEPRSSGWNLHVYSMVVLPLSGAWQR